MALAPGVKIDRYEILEVLGTGSMGTVYKAHDPYRHATVTVKLLPKEAKDTFDFGAHFERESHALSRISHPNIVSVFDQGVDDEGRPYLVREYVEGKSLAAVLSRGPLSEHDALGVAASVCTALVAAHAQGLIHRDLKPSNVLIPGGN